MTEFYICNHCGNIIEMVHSAGVPVMCCGEKMHRLVPNTSDGAGEKHLPVVTVDGNILSVNVGSVDHPMTAEHYIQWIYVETENGCIKKMLTTDDKPCATFCLNDKPVAVYAYCNLHGLWLTQL
ncbi:MAG: desulfoferrodoxin [Clostridia bacterium]|nr:desulfoferrodoxin [Clostridia bacterium]